MSEIFLLRSESDLGSGVLKFPDLKKRLEQHLDLAQKLPDLERLIRSVNDLAKDNKFSPEEIRDLKRIRQRAYDRKRNFKPSQSKITPIPELRIKEEPKTMTLHPTHAAPSKKPISSSSAKKDFWRGVQCALNKIDGERFIQALPSMLALLVSASLVTWCLWLQSLELYESSGFSQPDLAAAGGLLMIIGFSIYHSVTRSKLALILCLYAGGYETYFMVSGTFQDERVGLTTSIANDPELIFLNEKAEKARKAYLLLKVRYDDPSSEVHNNGWFKKKHLDPAWQKNEQAQREFLDKRIALEDSSTTLHVTWLKVLYRLGLVFLCMILVHALAEKTTVWQ